MRKTGDLNKAITKHRSIPYGRVKSWFGISAVVTLLALGYLCLSHEHDEVLTQADYLIYATGSSIMLVFVGWMSYAFHHTCGPYSPVAPWPIQSLIEVRRRNSIGRTLLVYLWDNGKFEWTVRSGSFTMLEPDPDTYLESGAEYPKDSESQGCSRIVVALTIPLGGPIKRAHYHAPAHNMVMFSCISGFDLNFAYSLDQIHIRLKTKSDDSMQMNVTEALTLIAECYYGLSVLSIKEIFFRIQEKNEGLTKRLDYAETEIKRLETAQTELTETALQHRSLKGHHLDALNLCRDATRLMQWREGLRVYFRLLCGWASNMRDTHNPENTEEAEVFTKLCAERDHILQTLRKKEEKARKLTAKKAEKAAEAA